MSKPVPKTSKTRQETTSLIDIDLNRDSKISQKIECTGKNPSPRFGHTIVMISTTKIVMFGGAIGDTRNFTFSNETYVLNIATKIWTKVESKLFFLS